MRQVNSPWRPVQPAALHWSDTGAPLSATYGDVYYSQDNGLEESRQVFLQGNDLPQRWCDCSRPHFCIGELGFGTGLNFLLTWQAWRQQPAPRPDLHYLSIEQHPLTPQDLSRALTAWPELQDLATALLDAYPGLLPGQHRILLEGGRVRLDLWWEDAGLALPDLAGRAQPLVDAWYLDGFAPARNQAMWTAPVLHAIAALSRPGARFATFTAAGQVRRDLAVAGFTVNKVPGYGRKRECLRGVIEHPRAPEDQFDVAPWDLPSAAQLRPEHVLIVGGGLAGCTTAAALASRGIAVTLLEQGVLSSAGSGNDQGILYTRLSRRHSPLADFSLQSFQFATTFYRMLFAAGALTAPQDGALCGSFTQSDNSSDLTALAAALQGLEELAQVLTAEQASELLGLDQPKAGYWYPRAGWLCPAAVCRALVASDNIRVLENCGPVALGTDGGYWHALVGGASLASATCAVVATGTGTTAMEPFHWLPLQAVRGQTTQLPTSSTFAALRAALCHEGYIAPARAGRHCIGATFDVNASQPSPQARDNRDNLARLATAVPAWRQPLEALDPAALEGRVGFRCTSPDYLPIVGGAPDLAGFLSAYGALRKNARLVLGNRGKYLPGLYINTAHGSRGLTSTPLAAELLASMLCGEPLPASRALGRALSPARFIIRDLARGRL